LFVGARKQSVEIIGPRALEQRKRKRGNLRGEHFSSYEFFLVGGR
jgi:hypothetical protein